MLTLVMGNFQQINHFKARIQKVLKAELPGDGKNKEDRKRLVDRALNSFKEAFTLPDESRDSIYEEFDPVLITTECIEKSIYKIFDDILDYEGDDAGFIKMFKANNAELIVKIISELEEGFYEGYKDVIVFCRVSIVNLLMAMAPPQQAATAKGIAIPVIMKFVDKCWNERPNKPAETPEAKPEATPQAPAAAKKEEAKP